MEDIMEISERQKMILKAIIDAHIESGEPVGSKVLSAELPVTLSSATIRNVMSELEKMGYLEKPHTSAGRVPSGKGYRLYVNSLMNRYALSGIDKKVLDSAETSQIVSVDSLLKKAAHAVSEFTDYTALAVKPRHKRVLAMNFKMLPMNDYGVLMIIRTSIGIVKTRFIEMGFKVSEDISFKLEKVLNEKLSGVSTEDVTPSLVSEMEKELSGVSPLLIPVMRAFMEEIGTLNGGELSIDGVNKMLKYPEYASLEGMKDVLSVLEKKDYILGMVSSAEKDTINICISPESEQSQLKGTSLVFKTITENNLPVAAIGVIGPNRMDYPKVISGVEYISDKIQEAMKTDGKGK